MVYVKTAIYVVGGQFRHNGRQQHFADRKPLFDKTKQVVVAQTNVKSADGLSKVIKIVMTDGQQEDSGYDGEFKTCFGGHGGK